MHLSIVLFVAFVWSTAMVLSAIKTVLSTAHV
jgi:hypothetical protein